MSEPESFTERESFDLHDQIVLDGGDMSEWVAGAHFPVHFGGMACTLNNSSETVSAVIRVADSVDGVTWTPVPFSVSNLGGLLSFTIVPLSQKQILFDSRRRYIRIATSPWNASGVNCVLQQHIPRSRLAGAEAY